MNTLTQKKELKKSRPVNKGTMNVHHQQWMFVILGYYYVYRIYFKLLFTYKELPIAPFYLEKLRAPYHPKRPLFPHSWLFSLWLPETSMAQPLTIS